MSDSQGFIKSRIKILLANSELNQRLLAAKLGIGETVLSRKLSNKGKFKVEELSIIANALNVSLMGLLDENQAPPGFSSTPNSSLTEDVKGSSQLYGKSKEEDMIESYMRQRVSDTEVMNKLVTIIRRSKERADEVVTISDREGIALYISDQLPVQTGYDVHEMIGDKPGTLLQRGHRPPELKELKVALDNKLNFSGKIPNFHKDGSRIICHLDIIPVLDLFIGFARFVKEEDS